MPPTRALALLLLLAPFGTGCSVWRYAHLVGVEEPKLFFEKRDSRASLATYRALADEAWARHGAVCPDNCLAGDYAWGFREGFAQYVYAGGTGEPPAVPPRPYWQLDLRSQEGAAAVRSWFEGYRRGVAIAREGGYRRAATLTVSASLADCDACGCPDPGASASPINPLAHPEAGPELAPGLPELVVPPAIAPDGVPLEIPSVDGVEAEEGGPPRLPLPTPEAGRLDPAETEPRTISADGESAAPQTAIFQIVR